METSTEEHWGRVWIGLSVLTIVFGGLGVILGKPADARGSFMVEGGAILGVTFVLLLLPAIIPLIVAGAMRVIGKSLSYTAFLSIYIPLWLVIILFWLIGIL